METNQKKDPEVSQTAGQGSGKGNPLNWLKKPAVIFVAIIGGVLFGVYYQSVALEIWPVGKIYLSLLKMCVFPILVTAIISSVGKLLGSQGAKTYIKRILLIFGLMLFGASLLGITMGYLGKPGTGLSESAQQTLGKMLHDSDKASQGRSEAERGILTFIREMIPENIFSALNQGASLQILFFSLILGIATGFLAPEHGQRILSLSDALFHAFFTIIAWIMYLLPIGLFCLIAGQIASTGADILMAMAKFVIIVYLSSFVLILINGVLIWYSTGQGFIQGFGKLKDALIIALGTQSTFASMPAALEGLEKLRVSEQLCQLVIPLGAVICRFSMILTYSTATVFTYQLYNVQAGPAGLVLALFLSILAAVAGAGTPGIVSIAMVSIVLGPLGLPSGAIIVLLLAINPVIEPITTMANIHANCAATALIAKGIRA